ncbi:MAG: glycosyltransferase family 2 protein [Flavobacteriales bacterium]
MPKVAIVLLNWNGKALLERFLPAVVSTTAGIAETWLADNGSDDGSVEWVQDRFPDVKIIRNDRNYGFAAGYNLALRQITADYYLLLNTDIEVTGNWLQPMVDLMQKDSSIACCQPVINSLSDRDCFEHAGAAGGLIDRYGYPFCRGRILSEKEQNIGQYLTTEVFWATGACLLIRADLFHLAGGFDVEFFAHMEEIDLCWRLKNRGFRAMSCSDSKVYHLGGGTLSYMSPEKTFLNFRNNLLMLYKNMFGPQFLFRMACRFILDGVAGVRFLLGGQLKHLFAVLRAHFSFYGKLPHYMPVRRKLKKESNHPNMKGLYNGSIISAFYIFGKKTFSQLDKRKFS